MKIKYCSTSVNSRIRLINGRGKHQDKQAVENPRILIISNSNSLFYRSSIKNSNNLFAWFCSRLHSKEICCFFPLRFSFDLRIFFLYQLASIELKTESELVNDQLMIPWWSHAFWWRFPTTFDYIIKTVGVNYFRSSIKHLICCWCFFFSFFVLFSSSLFVSHVLRQQRGTSSSDYYMTYKVQYTSSSPSSNRVRW